MNCDDFRSKHNFNINGKSMNAVVDDMINNSVCKKKKRPINYGLTNDSFRFNNQNSFLHSSPENSFIYIGKKLLNKDGLTVDKLNFPLQIDKNIGIVQKQNVLFPNRIENNRIININDSFTNNSISNFNNAGLIIHKSNNIQNNHSYEKPKYYDKEILIRNANNTLQPRNIDLKERLKNELGMYNKDLRSLESNCYIKCCNKNMNNNSDSNCYK